MAEPAPAAPKKPHVWQDVPAQASDLAPLTPARAVAVEPVVPAVPVAFARLEAADAAPAAPAPRGRVDLNTASVAELNGLGGGMIGRAIVAGRPYRSAEDLLAKRVLNRATFAQIKGQIGTQ
ncbi:helix-hairpin-helix domain-containing protein [Salinarimonas soli]|nr:helix-hairpin-helix domain-containing protein [Salinarimonas soli]